MKNLKKILIVIAILALLVASFATVIVAEEDASKGSVDKINEYIAKIEEEINKESSKTSAAAQMNRVTAAYDYIRDTDLVWDGVIETPEYVEAVAKIDAYCIQVVNMHIGSIESTTELNTAYSFITKCDPAQTTAGYAELVATLTAKNDVFVETLYATLVMPELNAEAPDHDAYYTAMHKARVAVKNVFKQLKACTWISEELYTKYCLTAYDLTTLMLDEYDYFLAQDRTGATEEELQKAYFKTVNDIRTIEEFVIETDITKGSGYAATMERLEEGLENAEAELAAKRAALDELAPFEEYDYGTYLYKDFDGALTAEQYAALSPTEKSAYDQKNSHFKYPNANGGHKTEKVFENIYGRENNGYLKFMYGPDNIHHYTYFEVTGAKGMEEYGLVFDFDMRINDVVAEAIVMQGVDTVRKDEKGYSVFANLFCALAGSDNFVSVRNGGGSMKYSIETLPSTEWDTYEEAVVLDVWAHYTMTYNPDTRYGALYVNYVKVFEVYHFGPEKFNCNYRFGPSTVSNWEGWDFDNFDMYYGTAFRIKDKFEKMTPDQKFEYFVNYAYDGMGNPEEYLARANAYDKAQLLIDNYSPSNPLVQKFSSIDYATQIKDPAMRQNLSILTEKIGKLQQINVTTENITKISDTIKDINAFVSKNASLINKGDTSDGGYQDQMAIVYETEASIKILEILKNFVDAVSRFERATTLSARTRYANQAAEYYAQAEFELEENRAFVANDPVVREFEKVLNKQKAEDGSDLPEFDSQGKPTPGYIAEDDPRYVKIFAYYDSFAKLLADREKLENSKNIINAMNAVTKMDGYEATDEYFEANYDELLSYTLIVRNYISTGMYDTEYPGVAEAIAIFCEMDPYFFEQLQLEHIETLTKMLAEYDKVNTLVEKVSVVNSVKAYFAESDTALNNTTVLKAVRDRVEDEREALEKLWAQNEVYEAELVGYETSYLDVLTQQTEYFINIINHMDSVIVFSEIEDLFAEASVYYYGINLDVEGALEAAEKYADYRDYINSVNANNEAFAMYMKDLAFIANDEYIVGTEKRDEMFKALKNVSAYADFVDAGNKNIAKQLETYYATLAAYENNITAIENAIYEGVQFTNALRTNKLPATVLSVIGKLINN